MEVEKLYEMLKKSQEPKGYCFNSSLYPNYDFIFPPVEDAVCGESSKK